jgi:recombination protein RecA
MASKEDNFFESLMKADDDLHISGADEVDAAVDVIPLGSPGLNDITGCGGVPYGRITQFFGPAGSGKTMMSMIAIKNAQAKSPDVKQLFIDSEGSFSPDWAEQLGVDISRVKLIQGPGASNAQKVFELLVGTMKKDAKGNPAGKSKPGFFDMVKDGSMNFNLVVLDSVGVLIPPTEAVAEVGKQGMAVLARFLSTELKKVSVECQRANVPVILINHVRDNMDPYAASQYTFAGGNQLKHQLSLNVLFVGVQRKDAQLLDEKELKIGQTIRAKVEKTKFGVWPRQCEFKVEYTNGIVQVEEELLELASDYEIIGKPTTMSYTYGDLKWTGREKTLEAIRSTPGMMEELEAKISEARKAKSDSKKKTVKV